MSVGIAAAVVGAGTAIYGVTQSSKAAGKAADAQNAANATSAALAQDELEFNKAQYERQMADIDALESIFGPIRQNLASYYSNMTPQRFQIEQKENIELQYERTNKQLEAIFSNNGMYNSGQALNAKMALEVQRETAMGQVQQTAQSQYAAEQSQFLAMGLNEQAAKQGVATQQQGLISQAYGSGIAASQTGGAQLAGIYSQQSQGYGQLASGGLQLAGYALGGGFQQPTAQKPSLGIPSGPYTPW